MVMAQQVTTMADGTIQIMVTYKPREGAGMLSMEEGLQAELNAAGNLATGELLERFDTDGSALLLGAVKFTSKGRQGKLYQTPYGTATVERHVYQSSSGGRTFCPLEYAARTIGSTTPKFAKMVSSKYAETDSSAVRRDLGDNHGREVSRCYVQDISAAVSAICVEKQDTWSFGVPDLPDGVHIVGLGIDGTCLRYDEAGERYRQAMVGTLALYNIDGLRMHTIYVGVEPEYGKGRFLERMQNEVDAVRVRYPWAQWVGVADGAKDNWPWLEERTDHQVTDFYHMAGYVAGAAAGACPRKAEREAWTRDNLHDLKHEDGAAEKLLAVLREALERPRMGVSAREDLQSAVTYLENNLHRAGYAGMRARNFPIGSGVTEAACKTVVKERMSGSGMKWKQAGARGVLTLRSLLLSDGRWDQLWQKIDRYGV